MSTPALGLGVEPDHPCDYPDGTVGVDLYYGQKWVCPDCGAEWKLVRHPDDHGPVWDWTTHRVGTATGDKT